MGKNGKKRVDPKIPTYMDANNPPPCEVCKKTANGMHYGVITCEGCKAFFRRSITAGNEYVHTCTPEEDKIPDINSLRKCQKCRMDKCLEVRMRRISVSPQNHTPEISGSQDPQSPPSKKLKVEDVGEKAYQAFFQMDDMEKTAVMVLVEMASKRKRKSKPKPQTHEE